MSESVLLKTERICSSSQTQNFTTITNLHTLPHKKLGTLKSCIFTRFGRNFLNVKALFEAVSTVLGQMIPILTTLNFGAVLCRGTGYGAV